MELEIKSARNGLMLKTLYSSIWDIVFKNGLSKICGRQPLKKFKW